MTNAIPEFRVMANATMGDLADALARTSQTEAQFARMVHAKPTDPANSARLLRMRAARLASDQIGKMAAGQAPGALNVPASALPRSIEDALQTGVQVHGPHFHSALGENMVHAEAVAARMQDDVTSLLLLRHREFVLTG